LSKMTTTEDPDQVSGVLRRTPETPACSARMNRAAHAARCWM
jgi:hypothetical protein